MRRITGFTLAVLAAALAFTFTSAPADAGGGCHDTVMKDERNIAVDLKGSCFWPTVVRIDEGQQITWTNRDDTIHAVTGVANSWGNDKEMVQGDSVSYSFASSGVFPYFCYFHPSMVGAVVVGDGVPATASRTGGDGVKAVSLQAPGAEADASDQQIEEDSDSTDVAIPAVIAIGAGAAIVGFGAAMVLRRRGTTP